MTINDVVERLGEITFLIFAIGIVVTFAMGFQAGMHR
jgi:hypothetical protein